MSAPILQSIACKDRTVILTYDQLLDDTVVMDAGDFAITSSGSPAVFNETSALAFGKSVYIGTAELIPVALVTVNYSGTDIKNLAGENAPAIINQTANNTSTGSDTTQPTPIGGTINGATARIYFAEVLDAASVPAIGSFGFLDNGSVVAVSGAAVVYGNRLTLTASVAAVAGHTMAFNYTQPGANPLRDPALNKAPSIFSLLLTNLSSAAGYYAGQQDIEDWFGIDNVASWSQLDNEVATADETRIARALAYADRQIDRELRTAGVSVPVATSSADFDLLGDIAAEMAGVWLYLARGKQDLGGGETGAAMAGKMDDHRKHADDELTDLIADGIDGASRFSDTSGAPLNIVAGNSVMSGLAADGLPLGCGLAGLW